MLDPQLAHKLMHVVTEAAASQTTHNELTPRETDVLQQAARGLTNKAIGYQLGISDRTVQGHLQNIFEKIDAANRTAAVMKAIQLGIVEPPS